MKKKKPNPILKKLILPWKQTITEHVTAWGETMKQHIKPKSASSFLFFTVFLFLLYHCIIMQHNYQLHSIGKLYLILSYKIYLYLVFIYFFLPPFNFEVDVLLLILWFFSPIADDYFIVLWINTVLFSLSSTIINQTSLLDCFTILQTKWKMY